MGWPKLTQGKKTSASGGNELEQSIEKAWLAKLQGHNERCHREGKSRMLDEFGAAYAYERKDAIKLLCGGLPPPNGRAGNCGSATPVWPRSI